MFSRHTEFVNNLQLKEVAKSVLTAWNVYENRASVKFRCSYCINVKQTSYTVSQNAMRKSPLTTDLKNEIKCPFL